MGGGGGKTATPSSSNAMKMKNPNTQPSDGVLAVVPHLEPRPLASHPLIVSSYNDRIRPIHSSATEEIAGRQKGISNPPLTLMVKKDGVPDLTMVDLPGITRVPVHGQPENIYKQISEMIMEYIRPEESIILNVLSATVDFSTCESIRMSQMAPEGLLEKVTADDVNIGLGYVCVRNQIGDETYKEARMEEAKLSDTHPLLSKIDKTIVGIPVLSEKLIWIQATIVAKCLPEIVRKINEKLSNNVAELDRMPKNLSTIAEAMTAFMQIMGSANDSLKKILLRGEYDGYPDDKQMHGTARFVEMLNCYADELHRSTESDPRMKFLMEEIAVLEESKGIGLPNFLPRMAFLTILHRKVNGISGEPFKFMVKLWDYIEVVVITVLMNHSEIYPPLQARMRRAAQNLITKMKERAVSRVREIIEMEKFTGYTCDPEYISKWNKLMAEEPKFLKAINNEGDLRPSTVHLEGIGSIEIDHLRQYKQLLQQAYDLKMRMTAYWKIVLRRLVDTLAMFLHFNVQVLVNREMEMEMEIVNDIIGPQGGGLARMLEESPSVGVKREKLKRSIKLLQKSADIVAKIMEDCYQCSSRPVVLQFPVDISESVLRAFL
ncbi:hypothetical protein CRG98_026183 [Punica granatum]|uniref:GED domain-containing protein n=1 Tax=Punica granatum TaxID=22663 RepID=A0A2I0JAW2_PUNGR|nr:hypothetical protein CRG98_026183 [Punica granatum]